MGSYSEWDSYREWKLVSLCGRLIPLIRDLEGPGIVPRSQFIRICIIEIISLVSSMDLELQPKSKSEFMSLVIQITHVIESMDLDSQPKPLSKLISLCTEIWNSTDSFAHAQDLAKLIQETTKLEPKPKLISLIYQIFSLVSDMNSKDENLILLHPQVLVELRADDNILHIVRESQRTCYIRDCCFWEGLKLKIGSSYYLYQACNGHIDEKATDEIKHPLHPKHSLKLFHKTFTSEGRRGCYCCGEYLSNFIFCCLACDFAMNMSCAEKPITLSIDYPKRHEHPLALFPRATSLICDVCALVDPTSAIYICPPCGFVVHERCIDLPCVIRISRHPHRISFTPSFNHGSVSCGVCRKQIDNDYGGYSCTKNGCSYAAHSKCATRRNIWDGEELEGVPEDDTEDIEPFVKISDGIIQHFSHPEHHLRLDENIDRDYDENKLCAACITPIYSGNLYACMQCNYILHEECANRARKMYHPIHPHLLTLARQDGDDKRRSVYCSACPSLCTVGLFYECPRKDCGFQVHMQCGVISEPLDHASHMHPLFLTSRPEEKRGCFICRESTRSSTDETFNCIECDFSLCFACATLPQKVRYKHDKHMLILSYGEETGAKMAWCEVCEKTIDTRRGFYMCDEDCCVTLHVKCMIGNDLYMMPGSSWFHNYYTKWFQSTYRADVVPNKQRMTRPICSGCRRRCPTAYFRSEFRWMHKEEPLFCSVSCMEYQVALEVEILEQDE